MKPSSASVGMLAPRRPRPTRAGVNSLRSRNERDCGAGGFTFRSLGRHRGLAQPDRIVRCVLLTVRRRARELDQMMRDGRRTNQALEVSAAETSEREFPEHPPVIAEHADLPEDV